MSSRQRIPDKALNNHDASNIEFGHPGPAILGLGKEALLTRLTTRRSEEHHAVIDYIFDHAEERNAHVYTTTHVLAEVIGTIRSGADQHTVNEFWDAIQASDIAVFEDGQEWKKDPVDADGNATFRRPFGQFDYFQEVYQENPDIDFKFHEASVVLTGVLIEEQTPAKNGHTVYIATFDGDLARLADEYQIDVIPYSTHLRNDSGRSV